MLAIASIGILGETAKNGIHPTCPDTYGYSVRDFAVMAYCVFNEEIWESQNMPAKAGTVNAIKNRPFQ